MLPETLRLQRLGIYRYVAKGHLFLDDPIVSDLLLDEGQSGDTYAGHKPEIIGTNFDYEPGSIKACFIQKEFDYIYLDISLTGHVVIQTHLQSENEPGTPIRHQKKGIDLALHITSQECPFKDFVTFLEAIAIDVEECAFNWDAEFCYGRLHWERRFPKDTGFFTVEWSTSREQLSHRMMLNTRQMVGALYLAFRTLVESPDYDRLRYEGVTYGEAFALLLSNASLDDLVREFVRRNALEAKELLLRLGQIYGSRSTDGQKNETRPIEYFLEKTNPNDLWNDYREYDGWIDPEWDTWNIDQRKNRLETLLSYRNHDWEGNNLQKTRSKLIEEWLVLESLPRP
jgi:hypothetical protein